MNEGRSGAGLGSVQLLDVVSSGPRGTVYEALDAEIGQRLSVRLLLPAAVAPGSEQHARMAEVCAGVAELQHPNIVPVFKCGWHGESVFVSAPLPEGESLARYRARAGQLPAMQSLAFAAQLLSALSAAHGIGLVHFALDPDVLLVTRRGQLQLDGFGWAAAVAARGVEVSPYQAPEQLRGDHVDHRADLYSAAAVIHELLTGALPIRPGEDNAVGPGSQPGTRRTAAAPHARLTGELQAFFRRALAGDPGGRYQTAGDLYAALQAALGTPVWQRHAACAPVKPARAHQRLVAAVRAMFMPSRPGELSPSSVADRAGLALAVACAAILLLAANVVLTKPRPDSERPAVLTAATLVNGASAGGALPAGEPPAPSAPSPPSPPSPPSGDQTPASTNVESPSAGRQSFRPPALEDAQSARSRAATMRSTVASSGEASPPSQRSPAQATHRAARPATRAALKPKAANVASLHCRGEPSAARELCQVLRCATAEFRQHPLCVRLHAEGRSRMRPTELGGPS